MDVDLAELFLINFTRSIIEIKAPETPILNNEKINSSSMQSSILVNEPQIKEKIEFPKFNQIQIKKIPQINVIKKPIKMMQRTPINYSVNQLSATEKLNTLIRDSYVNEIECIGADNPLIVKKSGMNQNTQINLSIEEIYEIIAEFSQKTRIPVINGRIKAALNDLILTAVLSETLGPRFIIQKMRTRDLII